MGTSSTWELSKEEVFFFRIEYNEKRCMLSNAMQYKVRRRIDKCQQSSAPAFKAKHTPRLHTNRSLSNDELVRQTVHAQRSVRG